MSKPIPATPIGVRTAWADAEHMRLHESLIGPRHAGITGEIVDGDTGEIRAWQAMRRGPDAEDLWATPLPATPEGGEAA